MPSVLASRDRRRSHHARISSYRSRPAFAPITYAVPPTTIRRRSPPRRFTLIVSGFMPCIARRISEQARGAVDGVDVVRAQTDELAGVARINDSGVRILHSARALRKVAVGK